MTITHPKPKGWNDPDLRLPDCPECYDQAMVFVRTRQVVVTMDETGITQSIMDDIHMEGSEGFRNAFGY